MCKHINTTELQNATAIAVIDQEAIASTIQTCVSVLNVVASALRNPDYDLTNDLRMTIFEVGDKLGAITETLNALTEAERVIFQARSRFENAKKALAVGRDVSLAERAKLSEEYELAKEGIIHCPSATLWAMKEKLNIILENDDILRDIGGSSADPFVRHTIMAFAEGIHT